MKVHDKLYIGGEWVQPATAETIDVVSPHSEEVVARVAAAGPADVDAAVAAARHAFDHGDWPTMPLEDRLAVVSRFAEAYAGRMADMATVITEEMGCPITFSQNAQAPAAWAVLADTIALAHQLELEEERRGVLDFPTIVRREPVGVVGAIVPWNVPQFVIMAKLAPALVTGCTVVVKPAPETPLDALLMAEILDEVGLPPGVVSVLPAGRETGEHLVAHPGVDKIAFTGSTAAGRRIAALCGEQLKRCSLELGGKSAAIVLDDAELDATVQGLKAASMVNSGQLCVAHTRVLASRSRYDEVVTALAEAVGEMRVGDPADPATELGPLVALRQQHRVEEYIALGQKEGARAVLGGSGRPEGHDRGWYVRPTVFADVDNDMRIAREEIFGPVVVVIPYDDEDQAVAIANDSEYGLSGSVWTADNARGLDVARRVRTGTYGVNQPAMDFGTPFGGFKASGIGREFGPEGLDHYLEIKSIAIPAP